MRAVRRGGTTPCASGPCPCRARRARAARARGCRRNSGPSTSRGSSTHHWIHGFSQHVERRRAVARRSSATRLARRSRRVSNECSSPDDELLEQHAAPRRGGVHAPAHSLELRRASSTRNVLRAPAPGRRLDDEREARPRAANASASSRASRTARCRAQGTPARAQHVLHARLVAEVVRRLDAPCRGCRAARAPRRAAPAAARASPIRRSTPPSCCAERRAPRRRAGRGRARRRPASARRACARSSGGSRSGGLLRDEAEPHARQLGGRRRRSAGSPRARRARRRRRSACGGTLLLGAERRRRAAVARPATRAPLAGADRPDSTDRPRRSSAICFGLVRGGAVRQDRRPRRRRRRAAALPARARATTCASSCRSTRASRDGPARARARAEPAGRPDAARRRGAYRSRVAHGARCPSAELAALLRATAPRSTTAPASTRRTPTSTCASSLLTRAALETLPAHAAARPTSSTATTGRRRSLPLYLRTRLRVGPAVRAHAHGAHDPQPRLPGHLPAGVARATRASATRRTCSTRTTCAQGRINFLQARASSTPTRVTTVSPTYAREIQTDGATASASTASLRARAATLRRHPERRRLRRVEPGDATATSRTTTRATTSRGKERNKQRAARRSSGCRYDAERRRCSASCRGSPAQKGFDLLLDVAARAAARATTARSSCSAAASRATRSFFARLAARVPAAGRASTAASTNELAHLHRGRRRHVPDAVALRAVRPQPDVQPALRHGADRAPHRRPRRHGRSSCDPRHGRRAPASCSTTTTPQALRWALERALDAVPRSRALAAAACATAWPQDFSWEHQGAALRRALRAATSAPDAARH